MTELTTIDALKQAREKIGKPENWTKGYYSKNVKGLNVNVLSKEAVSFCAVGSLMFVVCSNYGLEMKVAQLYKYKKIKNYLEESLTTTCNSITTFNDDPDTTHEDILNLFDRAIELAEQDSLKN